MTAAVAEPTRTRPRALRCQCIHPMPWGSEPCIETAAFEVGVELRTVLLCVECLEAWRESDRNRYGEVRLTAREL
jgi:hypothetical protein